MQALLSHPWPGNVRELENTLHRAVVLATGDEIDTDAIMMQNGSSLSTPQAEVGTGAVAAAASAAGVPLVGKTVAEVERDLIIDTLDHCLGNRTHAAKILGISIRTLRNKLKQYNDDGTGGGATGITWRHGPAHRRPPKRHTLDDRRNAGRAGRDRRGARDRGVRPHGRASTAWPPHLGRPLAICLAACRRA